MSSSSQRPPVRVLTVGAPADGPVNRIRSVFPDIALQVCDEIGDVPRAVAAFRPTVVYVVNLRPLTPECWRAFFASEGLRWLHVGNVGYDRVPAWDPGRLTVTNSAGAGADEMAEYVIGAMLLVNTGFLDWRDNQSRRSWLQTWWTPLRGKTLAAIGAGHIGQRIIDKARGLGLRIVAVRDRPQDAPGADITLRIDRLYEALAQADFVSLQVPLNQKTRRLIDAAALAHMRSTAWLINVSRGDVIAEDALIEALRSKRLGGAVLDVFSQEPLPESSPFWTLENVVVTPHVSGSVTTWYELTMEIFCDNLQRFQAGLALNNVVLPAPALSAR